MVTLIYPNGFREECDDVTARRRVKAGLAWTFEPLPETAMAEAPERAVLPLPLVRVVGGSRPGKSRKPRKGTR